MKILVICQYYYPEQFRVNDICEQLVKDRHSVTVLTGLPNYPSGNISREYRWGKKRNEIINGVNVIRVTEVGRKSGFIRLVFNYVSYALNASLKVFFLKNDFDIIFVYQLSPITMAIPGVLLNKIAGTPLYLYCCDIWPESMRAVLPNLDGVIYKLVSRISSYVYKQCDAITVTSKPFIQYFIQQHSIQNERLSYIPQHAEDLYLDMDLTSCSDSIVNFVFMGNIGVVQDIGCILDAAERIKDMPNFKIHFVGDGSQLAYYKIIVENKGIGDIVIFHGRYPLDKMTDFYRLADACLLTLRAETIVGLTVPSKLQGYMAAGKPVIGAINGAAQEIIKESGCGVCVNASDSKALAESMRDFIENPNKYKDCGENGRRYFRENFTKANFMSKIIERFNEIIEERYYV